MSERIPRIQAQIRAYLHLIKVKPIRANFEDIIREIEGPVNILWKGHLMVDYEQLNNQKQTRLSILKQRRDSLQNRIAEIDLLLTRNKDAR